MANKYNLKRPAENGLGGLTAPMGITEEGAERIQNLAGAIELPTNWDARAQELADKLQNRDPFAYNPNEDPLWQGMKSQYIEGGKRAMEDTMGQAAALTGGFANSYAQSAGQQSYNDFMTKLTAQLPAAYDRARAAYDAEGDALLQQLSVAQGMADTAYQRQRDALADQRYDTEWNWQMEQTALERERQSRLDAADQAYRDWQMGRAEAGDARDIALMMIQTGKMPSEDLLRAAGINSKDAKTMSDFYAGQYAAQAAAAAGRSSGGGGGGYRYTGGGYDYDGTTPNGDKTSEQQAISQMAASSIYGAAAGIAGASMNTVAGSDVRDRLLQMAQQSPDAFLQYYYSNVDGKYSNAAELYNWVVSRMNGKEKEAIEAVARGAVYGAKTGTSNATSPKVQKPKKGRLDQIQ